MNILALIYFILYGAFILLSLFALFLKIKERLEEKSDDDNDLDRFKNY